MQIRCKTKDGRIVKLHPIDYREQLALGHIAEGPNITITPPTKKEDKPHSVVVKPSTKPEDIPKIVVEASGDTVLSPEADIAPEPDTSTPGRDPAEKEKSEPIAKKKTIIQRVGKKKKTE